VNGPAIGAGIAFVASCDLIVASESATFGTTEMNVGLLGAFNHLARLVGPYRARRMFLTGELVSARDLHEWGSVDRVVAAEELLPIASELAHTLAGKSPIAMRLAKESIVRTEALDLRTAYRVEQDYTGRLMGFEDAQEATAAYLEKRDPDWRFR
jgi:enoyl-CoA hydratase